MRKLEKLVTADPPKPHIGPPDPPDGPGKRKMAKINIIWSSNDIFKQKTNFGGGKFFFGFFHSDRPQNSKATIKHFQEKRDKQASKIHIYFVSASPTPNSGQINLPKGWTVIDLFGKKMREPITEWQLATCKFSF